MKTRVLFTTLFLLSFLQIHAQEGWGEIQKITAIERYASQKLGSDIDMDGDYAVSGSDYLNDAYIFEKDSEGNWFEAQHLVSPDDNYNDLFGNAVAISGNTILVGARNQDYDSNNANSMSGAGAVYVYQRDNLGEWNYVQKLTPDDRTAANHFGLVVDIDGDNAIIGVWNQETDENGENSIVGAGAAYIFERDESGTWAQSQKIVASDRAEHDNFGRNGLAIGGDYAVVGAQYEDQNELGMDTLSSAGSAYIFKRNTSGDWNEVQKVVASDREQGEWFGHAIVIDGDQIVIASNQAGIQPANDTNVKRGAAYAFELDENDTWVETQIITASDAKGLDEFGSSLAMDGNTIIVGVPGRNYTFAGVHHPDMGAAYIYEKDNAGIWNQVQRMQGLDSDQSDNFGYSVAISGDLAMAGAYMQNFDENGANNISDAGAIYVFDEFAEPLVSPFECPYLEANIGDACDDGNALTENDILYEECECVGTLIPDCPDLSANIGDACDDGDDNTIDDVVLENCTCAGNIPTPGMICEAPIEISSLPYVTTDNTENYGDNYDSSNIPPLAPNAVGNPSSSYLNGNDVVYSYTPSEAAMIDIAGTELDGGTGFYVFTGCPFESTVGGQTIGPFNDHLLIQHLPVSVGTTYYIVISNSGITQTIPYTLSITEYLYDCPDLEAYIGDACDDGDANTIEDIVLENCTCAGNIPTPGMICEAPIEVTSLPYLTTDDTENYGDQYEPTNIPPLAPNAVGNPENDFLSGNDVVYSYTPSQDGMIDITVSEHGQWTGVYVFTGCPFASTVGGHTITSAINNLSVEQLPVLAGITYYIVISTYHSANQTTPYTLDITEYLYDCPSLSANIGDSCDDGDPNTENDTVNSDCECSGTAAVTGSTCEAPIELSSLPYITTDNTENYGNNYDSEDVPPLTVDAIGNPNSIYLNQNDVVYAYTPSANGLIDILVSEHGVYAGLFVFTGCPFTSTLGGATGAYAQDNLVVDQLAVLAGETYYIVISTAVTSVPTTAYTLSITNFAYDCPNLEANYGDVCDDGSEATYSDVITESCECAGTPYDCPALSANIGDSCDDGDPNTENDTVNSDCECSGTAAVTGSTCEAAIEVLTLPFITTDNTENYEDDYSATDVPWTSGLMNANYINGDDVVYTYTPSETEYINISVSEHGNYAGVFVFTGCPFEVFIKGQGAAGPFPEDLYIQQMPVIAGLTYYIVISTWSVPQTTPYTLSITNFAYDCPDLFAFIGDSCDDNNPNTVNDVITEDCECVGTIIYDCPVLSANIGDSCDDGDPATSNDVITEDCECVGTIVYDCPDLSANIGESCDDGDENTVGDAITENCECLGTLTYDCEDLQANIGESCDDNDPNTENDSITEDCECAGTIVYDCPALSANIGDSCDDGDENTVGDAISESCECEGTLTYDCEDLQANIGQSCDDENANTENDVITEDCECAGTVIYDCPDFEANYGDSCDDGDPNTINDIITLDCECAGVLVYDCPSLSANIGDGCDDGNTDTENDTVTADCECAGIPVETFDCPDLEANIGESCNDNDPLTIDDQITESCECAGTSIPPTECQNFVYYLADYMPNSGTTIYEVTLSLGVASLEYLTNIDDEVHLAYNNDNNTLYAVSKSHNQYRTLNPFSDSPLLSAPVSLPESYGQLTGAAFAPNGELYISSQSTNVIYSVDVFTNTVSVADAYSPITGGDIAFDAEGNLYMATNANGGGLYQTNPSDIMPDTFLAELDGKSTGIALTASGQLMLSEYGVSSLSLWNTNGSSDTESHDLMLNGSPFTLNYGDMASGCNTTQAPDIGPCLAVRTFYAQLNEDGETDIYEVTFSGSEASLTLMATVPFNASIGYNATDEVLYMVSKTGSILIAYDLQTETLSDEILLDVSLYSITAAAYHPEEQILYVGDANTNAVYAVSPETGEAVLAYTAEVAGGDLVVLIDETLFLATQSGNNLYELVEGSVNFTGSIPSKVTGAARSVLSNGLMLSAYQSTVFTEINTFEGSLIAAYKATLNGSPFTLGYGDMAGGCTDYVDETRPAMHVNSNAKKVNAKSTLTSLPNPTSGQSEVVFVPAQTSRALIEVYDMNGRNVATLFDRQAQKGEQYQLDFDGGYLPNGVYIYRLTTSTETIISKFIIAR